MTRLNELLDVTQTGSEAEQLGASLREKVVGQEEAIGEIVDVYQTYLAGMQTPGRPVGNFLFLGPTGIRQDAHGGGARGKPGGRRRRRWSRSTARSSSTAMRLPS